MTSTVSRRSTDGEGKHCNKRHFRTFICLFVIVSCCKVLVFPSYRSTDFDVHRHWKALTRQLKDRPVEWYYDDRHVNTEHTLDYPPGFAFFEYVLSNNLITQFLLTSQLLDDRCLQLIPDDEVQEYGTSPMCVAFLRSTVVVSDIVLWIGAWMVSTTTAALSPSRTSVWSIFLLIVLHPGLFWLDHVHFQYNGMLLGMLLISLTCLLRANAQPFKVKEDSISSASSRQYYCLAGAAMYALLLTFKHLYLGLSLWYFFYLLRRYCFVPDVTSDKADTKMRRKTHEKASHATFSFEKFLQLATVTVATLLLPFLPLLLSAARDTTDDSPLLLLKQIFSRLFPFERGLVHDYWAGNVWALYMGAQKVFQAMGVSVLPKDVSPDRVAVLLLIGLTLGALRAWKAAADWSNERLLLSFTLSAMISFMISYHVHEKAVLTSLIPMILLPFYCHSHGSSRHYTTNTGASGSFWKWLLQPEFILLEATTWGLLGCFPLLFESREMLLKLVGFATYLSFMVCVIHSYSRSSISPGWTARLWLVATALAVGLVLVVLEATPLSWWGRFEFAPLAITSLACAVGLIQSTFRLILSPANT